MKLYYSSPQKTQDPSQNFFLDGIPENIRKKLEDTFGKNFSETDLEEPVDGNEEIFEVFENEIPPDLIKQNLVSLIAKNKKIYEALQHFLNIVEKRKNTWEINSDEKYVEEAMETILELSNARFQAKLFLGRGNAGHVFIAPNAQGYCIKYLHSPHYQATSIEEEFSILSQVNITARQFRSLRIPQAHCLAKNMNGAKNFFTMEQVKGLTLEQVVEFPSKREQALGKQVAESVISILEDTELRKNLLADIEILHKSGVIHGDIHPRNIMIDHEGNLWLIDFGNAIIPVNVSVNATYDSIEGVKELDVKTFFNSLDKTIKLLKEQVLTK